MPYIELKNVTKYYQTGDTVIKGNDGISFTVEKGEFVIIVGASGAGKSTLLNILGGMDSCDEGDIFVDGKEISKYSDQELIGYRREDIGFIFQNYNLIPNLTALENVELASQIVEKSQSPQKVLEEVGLGERLNNFPAQLSGGEQQRVAIARALAKNPKLLLCDEPTGALDYKTGKRILKLLEDTCINTKTTVLVITHNQALTPMADLVIEISDGKVARSYRNEDKKSVESIEW